MRQVIACRGRLQCIVTDYNVLRHSSTSAHMADDILTNDGRFPRGHLLILVLSVKSVAVNGARSKQPLS